MRFRSLIQEAWAHEVGHHWIPMSWEGDKGQKDGVGLGASWGPMFCLKSAELFPSSPLALYPSSPFMLEPELGDASLGWGLSWCSPVPSISGHSINIQ